MKINLQRPKTELDQLWRQTQNIGGHEKIKYILMNETTLKILLKDPHRGEGLCEIIEHEQYPSNYYSFVDGGVIGIVNSLAKGEVELILRDEI